MENIRKRLIQPVNILIGLAAGLTVGWTVGDEPWMFGLVIVGWVGAFAWMVVDTIKIERRFKQLHEAYEARSLWEQQQRRQEHEGIEE